MSIVAQDMLKTAKALTNDASEADCRSAISRAYYSVYHGCLAWEKTLPMIGSNGGHDGGVHQQLINRLRSPAPELKNNDTRLLSKKIAIRVEAMKTKRKVADYDLDTEIRHYPDAINSCAEAEYLLTQMGQFTAAEQHAVEATESKVSAEPMSTTQVIEPVLTPKEDPSPRPPNSPGKRPILKRVL